MVLAKLVTILIIKWDFESRDAQQKHPPFFSYAPLHPPPAPPPPLFDPSRQAAQPLRPPTCISLWRPERDLSAAWPFVPRLSLLPRPRPPPVPAPPPPCPSSAAATTPPARSTRTGASSSTSATRTHIVTQHYGKPRCWHNALHPEPASATAGTTQSRRGGGWEPHLARCHGASVACCLDALCIGPWPTASQPDESAVPSRLHVVRCACLHSTPF